MTTKKGSLTFPNNPLAAMRALEDLDNATTLPVAHTTSSVVSNANGSTDSSADSSENSSVDSSKESSADSQESRSAKPARRARAALDPAALPEDPLQAALLSLLARPYDTHDKMPTTVTSIKVPTDLWERLGWVAQITGRNKQDIIAEALRRYFDTVRREIAAPRDTLK